MSAQTFIVPLYLPAQAASETEAIITQWYVAEGRAFTKGQNLAEIESAKSTFTFEAPCAGIVKKLNAAAGATISFEAAIMEIETSDASMKNDIPHADASASTPPVMEIPHPAIALKHTELQPVYMLGVGGYIPSRVVTTAELVKGFPEELTEEYIFGVTGIRERRWAAPDEKPSDMARKAALAALEKSGLTAADIDAIIVATTTPDAMMPSTACILQETLGTRGGPAFDINAACSGWLYGISLARGMIATGTASNVLVVAVDMQSQLLDKKDKGTYFLFGDGAGATVISATRKGHRICEDIIIADAKGVNMASRKQPGYLIASAQPEIDPYVRLDGHALFRFATTSFSALVRDVTAKSNWKPEDVRWVVPHQANGRILKAAAPKSGVPFERFYLNVDHVGNTSAASIPIALAEIERGLQKGDKIVFCSVGAGVTAAAVSVEW